MRYALLFLLVLTLGAEDPGVSSNSAWSVGPSAEMSTFFTTKIQPILVDHCYECHAGKKRYGGLKVDSLPALLAGGHDEGPAVIPWNADKSSLIRSVRYEGDSDLNMPPKKKLPDAVIADLVRWVEIGAPWPTGVATLPPPPIPPTPLMGKLHPALVHLPIGVLIVAALFEILTWWRGESWRSAVLLSLLISLVGAAIAIITGLQMAGDGGSALVERHERFAWITAALTSVALISLWRGRSRMTWLWIGRIALALAVAAVALTGHLGGELVHGPWW